ncbi:cytb-5.2 [Pristionchus pacificus]|uniref:Cytochrome b5 n=1 Tax=Pristionchus pacificus TaxID=54126 RepID=A0A2A6BT67_PRIPA|nr:cytb-5.2 [Pristionchus pacificus]|eukprot:PDM69094.1 cytb-5.2 [Pristionchus pacificus]
MVAFENLPEMTEAEVSAHAEKNSLWCIIDGIVYDLTKFADEHPGGDQVLLEQAGRDATEPFNDVGHSADAKEMAREYAVGRLKTTGEKAAPAQSSKVAGSSCSASFKDIMTSPTWTNFLIPTAVGILVFVLYKGVQRLL